MPQTREDFIALKSKLHARMKREDRWDRFKEKRSEVQKTLKGPLWLSDMAVAMMPEFHPLDGTPPEFTQVEYERRLAQFRDASPSEATSAGLAVTQLVQAEQNKVLKDHQWERLRKRVAGAIRAGRSRASDDEASVIRWVYKRAGTPVEEIDPLEVPGEGAVKLLRLVQDDEKYYSEFVKSLYGKLLTKSLEGTVVGGYADDGRVRLRVMARIDEIEGVVSDEDLEELLSDGEPVKDFDEDEDELTRDDAAPEDFDDAADSQAPVSRHGQTDAEGSEAESTTPPAL